MYTQVYVTHMNEVSRNISLRSYLSETIDKSLDWREVHGVGGVDDQMN